MSNDFRDLLVKVGFFIYVNNKDWRGQWLIIICGKTILSEKFLKKEIPFNISLKISCYYDILRYLERSFNLNFDI